MTLQRYICNYPTPNNHCIAFFESELHIPLHINGTFSFFYTRNPTTDRIQSREKIFITIYHQHWNPYCTLYELNEISILNYEGDITQENRQDHHLVDHDMNDVNIASITDTTYKKHI